MKRDKQEIKEEMKDGCREGLLELLFTALFFGVGCLILFLFGAQIDLAELDFDLIVLIGLAPVFLIGSVFFAVYLIKHRKKK
jgi:hypothetical protein